MAVKYNGDGRADRDNNEGGGGNPGGVRHGLTLDSNSLVTLSIYTRHTQQSAQLFGPCVSGEFDIDTLGQKQRCHCQLAPFLQ